VKIRDDAQLGQHSHVGMSRTENEDFFGYWEPDDDRTFDLKGRLALVCDGMGGHSGGEIASRLAVKTIIDGYAEDESDNVLEALRRSIEKANQAVYAEAQKPENKPLKGMGTTVTAVVQRRDMVYFGQVGDSRAYLIRNGQIKQMTKDHSLVQQLVDEGLLDESEKESHPDKNVILRSLGVKPHVEVDISYAPLAPGDMYLLCSDGLSGLVSDDEILRIVTLGDEKGDLRDACEKLVDLANNYGGHDNITVQVLKVGEIAATSTEVDQDTVTQSFTADQVEESIKAARAQAAAEGRAPKNPGPASSSGEGEAAAAASTGGGASTATAALPDTQPAMPVPKLAEKPVRPRLGAGAEGLPAGLLIAIGFVLGLLLGVGGTFAGLKASEGTQAKERAVEARRAANSVLEGRLAARAMEDGTEAFEAGDYEVALLHFHAAKVLSERAR